MDAIKLIFYCWNTFKTNGKFSIRDLLPPLTDEEYNQLEKNILENGFDRNFPLMEWHGFIVDGHNRYKICKKNNITDYVVGTLAYETKEEVMEWMLDIQLGRRNLSPIQRIAVAEKYRPIYEKQAKENNSVFKGNQYTGTLVKIPKEQTINTSEKLSSIAGVSDKTYRMGAKVLNSNDEDIKQRVLSGETSISAGYKELTQGNMIIVSGHQRVRACKELGIESIMCEIKQYKDDDAIIKDLLETNVKQRGEVGGSAKKVGLRIRELERIYKIKQGGTGYYGNQYSEESPNFSETPKTQFDLAKTQGMSVDTWNNYKALSEMIPELSDLVDTGIVTKTTALAMMKNLSDDEQVELISSLDTTKRITQREVQKYIDKIKELESNPQLPPDYESTKRQLKNYKSDYQNLQSQFNTKVTELQDLRKQIDVMKKTTPTEQYNQKLKDSVLLFCTKVATFIEQVGGYVWLTDKINEIPELERKGYIDSVNVIKAWAESMDYNINNNIKEIR